MRTALVACWLSAAAIAPCAARAEGLFPQPEIDYWNEQAEARRTAAAARPSERPLRPMDAGEFRWEDYEDPTTDVFWDDGGDYVPPRPLRVVAADPTPANVARYLRWQQRKLEVISALDEEVARQLASAPKRARPAPAQQRAVAPGEAEAIRQGGAPIDWRRLDVVFFYSSDCPHCQASVETVRALEGLGARVIPVQTDWRQRPPLLSGSVPYDEQIAREQPIEAVPTWIASYGGDRVTMQGAVTVQSIEVTLKMAQQQQEQQQQQRHGSSTNPTTSTFPEGER